MSKLAILNTRTSYLYLFAIVSSLCLSAWISYREILINPDAICYLLSAQEMGENGFKSAMQLCPQAKWPFYSALVYGVAKVTHLSYLVSANLLDAIFTALSVATFIAIVRELGGTRRVLWFAVAVILLSHQFNFVRQYIVRDHGFWAFYLISIYALLKFYRESNWLNAFFWSTSLAIATLFRIEGAIFLITLPFVSFIQFRKPFLYKTKQFFMLQSLLILAVIPAVIWLVTHAEQSLAQFGRFAEISRQFTHGFEIVTANFQQMKQGLIDHVLPKEGIRDAGVALVFVYLGTYLFNAIENLSYIYLLLVFFAWFSCAAIWTRSATRVVYGYLLVNLTVTSIFFIENFFLSKRYLIAQSLVLMLWVPFALDKLYAMSMIPKVRKLYYAVLVLVVATGVSGIFEFGHSKNYVRQAGDWLAANIPSQSTLYANDFQLMYYSQHYGKDIFSKLSTYYNADIVTDKKWQQFDYLALQISDKKKPKMAAILQSIKLKPIQQFSNKRGDQVVIYRVPHEERSS